MTLLDIIAQLGLGVVGLGVIVTLYVVALVPILEAIGRRLDSDGDPTIQFALGFLVLLLGFACGICAWFLGGWILSII